MDPKTTRKFIGTCRREKLHISVIPKDDDKRSELHSSGLQASVGEQILNFIRKQRATIGGDPLIGEDSSSSSSVGIIYCVFTSDCEVVAKHLQQCGVGATVYHGKLSEQDKQLAYHQWMSGEVSIVVATCAFGMGVDKPDVRWVL
mmetsp:Transcript_28362/g.47595  ORF Transcript_28362/g.47595 Transcript_28362/m.47595 type:complete len:145 (+) Transcript_28362:294-728(+)